MNSKELALSIAKFLDSKKATDLEVIQIGELTTIGDYFVVATASNTTLVKSLCEDLDEYLGRQGIEPKRIEGRSSAQWILMGLPRCHRAYFLCRDPQFLQHRPCMGRCPPPAAGAGRREKINLIKRPKRRMRLGGQTVETRI